MTLEKSWLSQAYDKELEAEEDVDVLNEAESWGQNIARRSVRTETQVSWKPQGQSLLSRSEEWGAALDEKLTKNTQWECPGRQCKGCGFGPWSGTKTPRCGWHQVLVQRLAVVLFKKKKGTNIGKWG